MNLNIYICLIREIYNFCLNKHINQKACDKTHSIGISIFKFLNDDKYITLCYQYIRLHCYSISIIEFAEFLLFFKSKHSFFMIISFDSSNITSRNWFFYISKKLESSWDPSLLKCLQIKSVMCWRHLSSSWISLSFEAISFILLLTFWILFCNLFWIISKIANSIKLIYS